MTQNVAVILAGCGVYDGSEIQEVVLALLALHKQGASVRCFAPNISQMHVIDHQSGEPMEPSRNVLVEAARITRGAVSDLATYDTASFDALVLPGGFGAAKNLSDFAVKGADCTVNEQVAKAVLSTKEAGKVIGAMCIAPVILARLIPGVTITLGDDGDAAKGAEKMGANHKVASHGEVVVDHANKVVTTPAYMLDANISQIEEGASALIEHVLAIAGA